MERERATEFLDTAFTECVGGRGRIALISGAVASGKTELLRSFTDRCTADGGLVLSATATRAGADVSYGVVRQLVARLPVEGTRPDGSVQEEPVSGGAPPAAAALVEVCRSTPLVVVVDDVHWADRASLEWLSHLAHRARSERIAVALTESAYTWPMHSGCRTELVRQAHFGRIRLAPLTEGGVAEVLSRHIGPEAAGGIAAEAHRTTGGNQLLVRALAEDYLDSLEHGEDGSWEVGESYRQAVLTCLHRSEPGVLETARALAVLDTAGSVDRVAELLDRDPRTVARALQDLQSAGLAVDDRFRHPAARTAVHDALEPGALADLHTRAARLSSKDGSVGEVADHLVAARRVTSDWAVDELRRAAEEALDEDEEEVAVRYLEFALSVCTDPRQSASLRMLLLGAERRNDPEAVERHWAPLMKAQRAGLLDVRQTVALLRVGMWHGRTRDGAELVDCLRKAEPPQSEYAETVLTGAAAWLRHAFPSFLPAGAGFTGERSGGLVPPPAGQTQAAALLSSLFSDGPGEDERCSRVAEQILQTTPLSDESIEPVAAALQTLIYTDRLALAARWCGELLAEAESRRVVWWQAILAGCRAENALRGGEPAAAERYAARALSLLGMSGWGVVVGAPLGTLLRAATAMGDFDSAAAYLRTPVPEETFRSRYGVQYLQARGGFYLATGRLQAALDDFAYCGGLTTTWGIDAPALVPWRSDLAETYLRLGEHAAARRLAEEQAALAAPGSRAHGAAVRILAATAGHPHERLRQAKDAVEILRACGARLELVQALHDLGHAHRAVGEAAKARVASGRAARLASTCGARETPARPAARPERSRATIPRQAARRPPAGRTAAGSVEVLTLSERKVAALASLGYTNREISAKLYITVSTVEQHLTKVFRKLRVKSRTDLPTELELEPRLAPPTAGEARHSATTRQG